MSDFNPDEYLNSKPAGGFDPDAYLGDKPQKPGFFKSIALDLYHNAPEIAGNTIGSIVVAPAAAAATAAAGPTAGLAVESAGAGLGQGVGSLAKSGVQNTVNLIDQIRGKEPTFPDAPSSTSDTFKKAGIETAKGATTPIVGKVVGKALKYAGKGAAAAGEALTGKPAEEIEQIFERPSIMLAQGKQSVKDAYQAARAKIGMAPTDLMKVAERASTPGKTAEYSAQEIANPVIAAVNNGVKLDPETLIGGREAIDDLYKSAPRGSTTRAAYAEVRTKVNKLIDELAPDYRKADQLLRDNKIAENFMQPFPDVSLNKHRLGEMLGSGGLMGAAIHANPATLPLTLFASPAVTGTTAAVTGLAKKGVDKALQVPAVKETLRAAISKLLTK